MSVDIAGTRGLAGFLMAAIGVVTLFFPQLAWKAWVTRTFGPPGIGTRLLGAILLPVGIYIMATAERL